MRETHERTEAFRKSSEYEALLAALNQTLAAAPTPAPRTPTRPVVFVVGPPRAGTTLLHQCLAATGGFGYVSNAVARFHQAPWIGVRIQRALAPVLGEGAPRFRSRAGHTEGWDGPHEFGYFWERHFPFADHHEPAPAELAAVGERLTTELGWIEQAHGKPLLFKNVILDFVIGALADALPTARFVCARRPWIDVAASILRLRREFYGTEDAWFSVRPRRAAALASRPPAEQIAAQLADVARALSLGRERLGARWRDVDYADLCARPRAVIGGLLNAWGVEGGDATRMPERFDAAAPAHDERLAKALQGEGLDRGA